MHKEGFSLSWVWDTAVDRDHVKGEKTEGNPFITWE